MTERKNTKTASQPENTKTVSPSVSARFSSNTIARMECVRESLEKSRKMKTRLSDVLFCCVENHLPVMERESKLKK